MRLRVAWTALAAVGLVAPAGCATGAGGPPAQDPLQETTVEVTNHNWNTIHAYVMAGGARYSLGMVTTTRTQRFIIPAMAVSSGRNLIFLALPIGSSLAYVSEEVIVRAGDAVQVTIQNDLSQSFVTIF